MSAAGTHVRPGGRVIVLLLAWLVGGSPAFVADASTEAVYSVDIPRSVLREYLDDIGLFARNMPGVVSVTPLGKERFLYATERQVPLGAPVRTTFLIKRMLEGDSATVYLSDRPDDPNFMSCRVVLRADGERATSIAIRLRIRLSREGGSEIHWLAPVLGEEFISKQMTDDLGVMLREFIERSSAELYARTGRQLSAPD